MGLSVLAQRPLYNRVPFWTGTVVTSVMACGLGDGTPTTIVAPTSGLGMGFPSPSPDGNWLMWAEYTSANLNRIRVCAAGDPTNIVTVASWTTNPAHVVGISTAPCWLTNDYIVYDKYLTTVDLHELRYVGRDGTGDTLIEGPITSRASTLWPSVSQDGFGGYISYCVIPDNVNPSLIYVTDYSSSTLVHTCQWRLSTNGQMIPAWQRGADVLGFCDMPNPSSPGTSNWYTVLPDGTGKTNIYADTSLIYWALGRQAWLSDDSGMVTLKALGGDVLTGSDSRVTIMDGAGGGPADLSPSLDTGVINNTNYITPYVWYQADGATYRIYVPQYLGSGEYDGVSVLEDGSDLFVDSPYAYSSRNFLGFNWL